MTDLLRTFRTRERVLAAYLRYVRDAKAEAARWPNLIGPQDHVDWCEYRLALHLHHLGLRPRPADYTPRQSGQASYIEAVMSIPLSRKSA